MAATHPSCVSNVVGTVGWRRPLNPSIHIFPHLCAHHHQGLMLWADVDSIEGLTRSSVLSSDLGLSHGSGDDWAAWEYFVCVSFLFYSTPLLSPPQSGAGKGKLTRSLAVCEESSARPGGESLQDQVYAPVTMVTCTNGTHLCVHGCESGIRQCFGGEGTSLEERKCFSGFIPCVWDVWN